MTYVSSSAAKSSRLTIEPYTPNIGAVIHDIDLANVEDETLRADLRQALVDYQVLFFRNQSLTPEQQVSLARVFGDPDKAKAFFPRHDRESLVEILEARPGVSRYGTDEWHADITFVANPPTGTVLYAHVIPASGGDTLWASATGVYDALPPSFQQALEGLEAIHSFEHSGWPPYFYAQPDGESLYRKARANYLPVVHPVIRTHPVSGRKLVYISPNFTDRIKGFSRQESDALLRYLFAGFARPEVQARLRWEKHTVAIWDNRSTLHYGVADYQQQHRLLHRVTFGEDRAF
jgi:taurine dioxygenase